MPDAVRQIWHDVVGTQPAPQPAVVWATALLALAVVVVGPAWRIARHVVTIAHEGAHALVAVLTGRRLTGVRVHADSSGLTLSRGPTHGPGMIATLAAGYLGPGLLGLAAAGLLHFGHALGVLWAVLALLAVLLLQIRNFYGLYAVVAAGAIVFAVSWWAPGEIQTAAAYAGTWFLLFAAPKTVFELQRARRRAPDNDADQLARLTWLPGWCWVGFFLAVDVGALLLGGYLISRPAG